jgi:alkylation response protein AidB-like acyl-CoA dehydrogenase
MDVETVSSSPSPLQRARRLAASFAQTAVERDALGGTPKAERDALRSSGLLALSIPTPFGGLGGNWRETFEIVRCFAQVDSSLAHVFGFHHLLLATVRLFSRPQQWQPWFEQTANKQWFWGNALNPLDRRTQVQTFSAWREFTGHKSFCSGALDSQMLIVSANDERNAGRLLLAAIPTARSGITVHEDWHCIGQRQTDSGSLSFDRVRVEEHELLLDPGPLTTPFSSLRPLIAQLHFANLFLGVTQGALATAREYTCNETRPWFRSTAAQVTQDPLILARYGEFWVALESVRVLVERAIEMLDEAWNKEERLGSDERGHLAVAIATAKVCATKAGLELCSGLFEVTGARSTHAALRFDRYWRNLRTQSLHDPVDYKIQELGEWALNQTHPAASFYS